MRILYVCHYSRLTGFGRAARDYLAALAAAGGHELRIVDWRSYPGSPEAIDGFKPVSPEPRYRHLDALVTPWPLPSDPAPDVVVAHGQATLLAAAEVHAALYDLWPRKDPSLVAMTTWETSVAPPEIMTSLVRYNGVIVPSDFSASAFDHAHVVPHCFDPGFWEPNAGVRHYGKQRMAAITRFYAHGAWSERKNHPAILRAYLYAFTAEDDVHLTIASQGADQATVQALLQRSGTLPGSWPALDLHTQPLSQEDVLHLHHASDCFVTATRGEGFGLPVLEAAVLGKPIIAPGHGGHAEILERDLMHDLDADLPEEADPDWRYSGWREIPHVTVPCFAGEPTLIFQGGHPVGMLASRCGPGMDCRQTWAEPSILELAHEMRAYHDARSHGYVLVDPADRLELERRFGYAAVAQTLITALQEIITS